LSRLGDPAQASAVQRAIGSERNEAILLAGHFAGARLSAGPIDAIVEALTRNRLHDQALQYLFELASGRAALFARYVQDPEPRIRIDVADVLGLSADPLALPLIEPLIQDKDPNVAKAAIRAVARLRASPGA
jgi:HEAT repeat protein